ncbi:ABC transporter ATP-binding protein [Evansella sp. AB-P1]|uniref:ATP-binding cassette domain-containing protein n=1 Tax=Evansella sp. AB-P1 TaxID=3037653 RepID=UPI00241FD09E|nr:ABC transporter ATP-binding protein [Evansella sp. AB-P1]MDG5786278.1 ABC transporter ATP-binding protein [Evansella sp. AB-P1]
MTYRLDVHVPSYTHGKKEALKNIRFQLESGTIYGLWGRNGAGKTTLMRCITGLLKVNKGYVQLNEASPFENREVLEKICFIQENHPLFYLWKVKDALKVASYFYPNWSWEKAKKCLVTFELQDSLKVNQMSKGMKTALALTIGLSSGAPVLIFDEPTNGLDASLREKFYDLLMDEHSLGDKIIILSTHYIQELQRYIEELIVLHDGELILQESLERIRERTGYIHGKKETLPSYINNENILDRKQIGPMLRLMIEDESLVDKFDENVDLQDYLLRKTDGEVGEETLHEGA